jgi:hypothetical protein
MDALMIHAMAITCAIVNTSCNTKNPVIAPTAGSMLNKIPKVFLGNLFSANISNEYGNALDAMANTIPAGNNCGCASLMPLSANANGKTVNAATPIP